MYITLGNKTTLRGILCYKSNSQNGWRENASLRKIQTIFLLTLIYKDFFTINFVAVQLPLMPSYSIKENVLHHYYLSNTNSALIQDPDLSYHPTATKLSIVQLTAPHINPITVHTVKELLLLLLLLVRWPSCCSMSLCFCWTTISVHNKFKRINTSKPRKHNPACYSRNSDSNFNTTDL